MIEAYYLKIITTECLVKYIGHSECIGEDHPSFKSLMEFGNAKTKKAKILKRGVIHSGNPGSIDFKEWQIKEIMICKAKINFEEDSAI